MNYTLTVDSELKIIRHRHSGLIERKELGEVWQQLLSMKEFTELEYNLLSDYRNAKFNFSVEDTPAISTFLNSLSHILKGKREVVIVDDPHATAIAILFENELLQTIGFEVKVFSTESAALKWLIS